VSNIKTQPEARYFGSLILGLGEFVMPKNEIRWLESGARELSESCVSQKSGSLLLC